MNWQNITVGKLQEMVGLSANKPVDEQDIIAINERLIGIVYDLTPEQVDSMSFIDFQQKVKTCRDMLNLDKIPGKAETSFKVGKRKFFLTYDIQKIRQRQFVELLTYGQDMIPNLHRILASVVQPVKGLFNQRVYPNNEKEHAELSTLMLEAPITAVYHAAVFFCRLYTILLKSIRSGTVADMMSQGMTKETAEYLVQLSISTTDGFIPPNK